MKKLFLLVFVAVVAISFAQPAWSKVGLKGGLNVSALNAEGLRSFGGYQVGLAIQADLPAWFTIEPDFMFHSKEVTASKGSMNMGFLELPVNIQWGPRLAKGNIRAFGQVSPFIGYAITKNMKDTANTGYTMDTWDGINRFEYGVGAGFGIQLWKFQVTALYNWNLSKLSATDLANSSFNEIFSEANFDGYTITLAIIF